MEDKITEQIKIYDHLYKELDAFYHHAAQWAGLPDAAHWVLYRLCGSDTALIQSDLCKEWCFSKQTINSAVGKLLKLEYVDLTCLNGNGNRKLLTLTEKGKCFCDKYVVPILETERKSFEGLTDDERNMMISLMRKQLEIMNKEAQSLWQ